jgi:hypothetical protein
MLDIEAAERSYRISPFGRGWRRTGDFRRYIVALGYPERLQEEWRNDLGESRWYDLPLYSERDQSFVPIYNAEIESGRELHRGIALAAIADGLKRESPPPPSDDDPSRAAVAYAVLALLFACGFLVGYLAFRWVL